MRAALNVLAEVCRRAARVRFQRVWRSRSSPPGSVGGRLARLEGVGVPFGAPSTTGSPRSPASPTTREQGSRPRVPEAPWARPDYFLTLDARLLSWAIAGDGLLPRRWTYQNLGRGGRDGPEHWDAEVRPAMPVETLEHYLRGRDEVRGGRVERGVAIRRGLMAGQQGSLSQWLSLETAEAWGHLGRWDLGQATLRSALESARDPVSRVVLRRSLGDACAEGGQLELACVAHDRARELSESAWGELDERQKAREHQHRALAIQERLAPVLPLPSVLGPKKTVAKFPCVD